MTHLTRHTTTPDECYYLIWDGCPDVETLCERIGATRIDRTDEAGVASIASGAHNLRVWRNCPVG